VSPTVKGLTVTPTEWQNLCCKEHITIVDLNGIALQTLQLYFNCIIPRDHNQSINQSINQTINRDWVLIGDMSLDVSAACQYPWLSVLLLNVFGQIATFWEIITKSPAPTYQPRGTSASGPPDISLLTQLPV
jgi:hypothetical protein